MVSFGFIVMKILKECLWGKMKFNKAWDFLVNHKMFLHPDDVKLLGQFADPRFLECLDIDVVLVNPKSNKISNKSKKNTKTRVWLECGGFSEEDFGGNKAVMSCHDIYLDCGGDTFEKAIIKLAKLVKKFYNEDGTRF